MALISETELLDMLTDLGESVSITNISGDQEEVDTYGIFQRQFVEIGSVEGYHPTIQVCTHVLPVEGGTTVERGDTLRVNAGGFTIIGAQPDGDGSTLLVLREGA